MLYKLCIIDAVVASINIIQITEQFTVDKVILYILSHFIPNRPTY